MQAWSPLAQILLKPFWCIKSICMFLIEKYREHSSKSFELTLVMMVPHLYSQPPGETDCCVLESKCSIIITLQTTWRHCLFSKEQTKQNSKMLAKRQIIQRTLSLFSPFWKHWLFSGALKLITPLQVNSRLQEQESGDSCSSWGLWMPLETLASVIQMSTCMLLKEKQGIRIQWGWAGEGRFAHIYGLRNWQRGSIRNYEERGENG